MAKFSPDTSVIFNGLILDLIKDGELGEIPEILISNVVVAEVEYKTNINKEIGYYGLKVLKNLRKWDHDGKIKLQIVGKRPSREEIKMAPGGELDALIRDSALKQQSTLITSDRLQGDVGIFEGLDVISVKERATKKPKSPLYLKILDYFEENVMSVHIKRDLPPHAKKGQPGNWYLVKIRDEIIDSKKIEDMALEIIEFVREDDQSFIEIEKLGAVVAQLREYRIVITRPPFSNNVEITAVRPLVVKTLSDYALDTKLIQKLERAEGILVCGAPGAGKSTFSAALANFYLENKKVVKTLESVRDLQVKPEITQYTKLEGSLENSADILLLVRPDYTIFDEVRVFEDFKIFADFRLSGVGMVGVVHSSSAIDAVQRFIGRIELGMLPSIIDTIIFIEGGDISTVLILKMTVKVPHGFRDKDLARPVIEVRDYQTGQLEFELYSFGQDVVINPIKSKKSHSRGGNLLDFSKDQKEYMGSSRIELDVKIKKDKVSLNADPMYASQNINVFADGNLIFSGSLSRNADINLSLSNKEGQKILKQFNKHRDIYAEIR